MHLIVPLPFTLCSFCPLLTLIVLALRHNICFHPHHGTCSPRSHSSSYSQWSHFVLILPSLFHHSHPLVSSASSSCHFVHVGYCSHRVIIHIRVIVITHIIHPHIGTCILTTLFVLVFATSSRHSFLSLSSLLFVFVIFVLATSHFQARKLLGVPRTFHLPLPTSKTHL